MVVRVLAREEAGRRCSAWWTGPALFRPDDLTAIRAGEIDLPSGAGTGRGQGRYPDPDRCRRHRGDLRRAGPALRSACRRRPPRGGDVAHGTAAGARAPANPAACSVSGPGSTASFGDLVRCFMTRLLLISQRPVRRTGDQQVCVMQHIVAQRSGCRGFSAAGCRSGVARCLKASAGHSWSLVESCRRCSKLCCTI